MNATGLADWDSFYVIVGSSAAALTGLQFVVMALAADSPSRGTSSATVDAFGTPNVVHFSAVLLVAAILSAPWLSLTNAAIPLTACSIAGVLYAMVVVRRARRQTGYRPVLEDWIWHGTLPIVAYTALTVASLLLARDTRDSLFSMAAALLLLLFIGIHNAWDTVTYLAVSQIESKERRPRVDGEER